MRKSFDLGSAVETFLAPPIDEAVPELESREYVGRKYMGPEFEGPEYVGLELESLEYAGDDATWVDAPVAMVVDEGMELETIDLDAFEIPIELGAPVHEEAEVHAEAEADPFTAWLWALVGAAESANTLIGLEALRQFVVDGRAPLAAFPSNAVNALAEGKIGRCEEDELVATAAFLRIAAEWRRILCNEGGDFSKCGSRTFDDWSADFLARIVGAPLKFDWFKRELRRRGIAAFGLVENAA